LSDINQKYSEAFPQTDAFSGTFISHLMAVASLNCYAIGLYEAAADKPWHAGNPVNLGLSLQSSLALINHCCDPNVIRCQCYYIFMVTIYNSRVISK
jgi:hypothetical protein